MSTQKKTKSAKKAVKTTSNRESTAIDINALLDNSSRTLEELKKKKQELYSSSW